MKKKKSPFQGESKVFWFIPTNKTNQKQTTKTTKKGSRRQVRWLKGPPHLTLKPFQKSKQNPTTKTKQPKNKPKTNQKQNKTNKEGLGPIEVALWATSPDPLNPQEKTNQKQTKKNTTHNT